MPVLNHRGRAAHRPLSPQLHLLLAVQMLWQQQLSRLAAQHIHLVPGSPGSPGARQLLQNRGGALRPAGPPLQHLQGGGKCRGHLEARGGPPRKSSSVGRYGKVKSKLWPEITEPGGTPSSDRGPRTNVDVSDTMVLKTVGRNSKAGKPQSRQHTG